MRNWRENTMDTKRFKVCAGWYEGNPEIGKCYIERARGVEIISFEYSREWLAKHPNFLLGPDVQNILGRQYPPDSGGFGFLSDTAPDRWGRTLMNRRERIQSIRENRAAHKLFESDYILGVHDEGRMGGLRFQDIDSDRFLSDEKVLAAPPMAQLRALQDSVKDFESDDDNAKWLQMLLGPGSSLGGARPKANVMDEQGQLWIAKFPSRNDSYDVGAWEMLANDLARAVGINVPSAHIERFQKTGSTFLVKRFDRVLIGQQLQRRHMSSAMNELGAKDGESAQYSYLHLAEILETKSTRAQQDLHELWTRIAFNICIGNTDDHLRNHAFLYNHSDELALAPAYDMNPDPDKGWLSLNIDLDDPSKDIRKAVDVAEYFRYHKEEAVNRIKEMQTKIQSTIPMLFKRYHISESEQKRMQRAFSETYRPI